MRFAEELTVAVQLNAGRITCEWNSAWKLQKLDAH